MSYVMLDLTMLDKLSIINRFSQVIKSFLIISSIKNILILCLLKISHCHITLIDLIYSFSKLNHHNISASILNISIIKAWFFLALFSSFDNHIELIISFNSELYFFNSILRYFILILMLKILIFRLCMTILCHFSSFLMLLTSKTCFHIALCASKTSAMYFFKIIKAMLFFFSILTIVMTLRSIFVFFNVLFIESCIFIIFNVQFSFLKLIMSLFS